MVEATAGGGTAPSALADGATAAGPPPASPAGDQKQQSCGDSLAWPAQQRGERSAASPVEHAGISPAASTVRPQRGAIDPGPTATRVARTRTAVKIAPLRRMPAP